MMEKLPMCRICLVGDVRMYVVVNKNLHELYEKLTDVPFVTEDHRPMLACSFCCNKLKQCYQFLRKCLEAEELFSQMLNEDYTPATLINPVHLEVFNGFSNSPIELISIIDDGQTESAAVKEEVPDVSERLEDIVYLGEEHQTGKLELVNEYQAHTDVEDTPALKFESDSIDIPLMVIKTEVEDDQESVGAPVEKKSKLETRRSILGDRIITDQKKHKNNRKISCVSKIIMETQKPFTQTQNRVFSSNNTALGTSCRNNISEDGVKCEISINGDSDINRCRRLCVEEKPFKCVICQRNFTTKRLLIRHFRTHTAEKPFKCDICQRSFNEKHHLRNHIRIHTGEELFKCDICPSSFKQKIQLTRHISVHTGEKPFKCHICQSSFSLKSYLTYHIRTHTDEKPFKCDICQRSFKQNIQLARHIRNHTVEKPFKCHICQSSFRIKGHLTCHIRTHTGEKPFKCDICQSSFRIKGHLTCHIRTHTGEKPFKCDICQSSFKQKNNLTRHVRVHSSEKPYKCDICQSSFSLKSYLKSHFRKHTDEKPFKCDSCQSSFRSKAYLRSHMLYDK